MEIFFSLVTDVRVQSYVRYKLSDILFIVVCGYICGYRDEEEIADFAAERADFFAKYMVYERMPCAATISNIMRALDPCELELCLHGIYVSVLSGAKPAPNSQICIDGKTICGANSIHIVTALLADFRFSIGQMVVGENSNEIIAVRELLDMLTLENRVVTTDAMHCQEETLTKIIEKKGDYVVQVKRNHRGFYEDIEGLFKFNEISETHQTVDKQHGRIETRTCKVLPDEFVDKKYFSKWNGLKKIFLIERKTEKKGVVSEEISYYISSKDTSAENLLSYARKHWQIESFHWIMDVIMGEDSSFVRDKSAQFCLNIIRKFAISAVKNYIETQNPKKKSVSGNMRKALLNPTHLEDMGLNTL